MAETEIVAGSDNPEPALFLIEMPHEGSTRYVVCQTIITVDPQHSVMGIPWGELAALFRGRTLRAIPLPGRPARHRLGDDDSGSAAKLVLSLGDDPGSAAKIELDIGSAAKD